MMIKIALPKEEMVIKSAVVNKRIELINQGNEGGLTLLKGANVHVHMYFFNTSHSERNLEIT